MNYLTSWPLWIALRHAQALGVDLLHPVVIQCLTVWFVELRWNPGLYTYWQCCSTIPHLSPCGTIKLFSSQKPCFYYITEWYRYEVQSCSKCLWEVILFPHLCGQAVWDLQPELPAWAAQVHGEQESKVDCGKVLLLSKVSAGTLSLSRSELLIIWIQDHVLGMEQGIELCGSQELRRSQHWGGACLWLC